MKIIFIIASCKQKMHKSAAKVMKLMIWVNEWMEVKGEMHDIDARCCQFIFLRENTVEGRCFNAKYYNKREWLRFIMAINNERF